MGPIFECLGVGAAVARTYWLHLVLALAALGVAHVIVFFGIQAVLVASHLPADGQRSIPVFALAAVIYLLDCALAARFLHLALKAHDGRSIGFTQIFATPPHATSAMITLSLVGVLCLLGSALMGVPGIMAAAFLGFAPLLVLDRGLKPTEALRESARLASGSPGMLAVAVVVFYAVTWLGVIPMLLGLPFTTTVATVAWIHMYRGFVPLARPNPRRRRATAGL